MQIYGFMVPVFFGMFSDLPGMYAVFKLYLGIVSIFFTEVPAMPRIRGCHTMENVVAGERKHTLPADIDMFTLQSIELEIPHPALL